jgi:hypothetical protein
MPKVWIGRGERAGQKVRIESLDLKQLRELLIANHGPLLRIWRNGCRRVLRS